MSTMEDQHLERPLDRLPKAKGLGEGSFQYIGDAEQIGARAKRSNKYRSGGRGFGHGATPWSNVAIATLRLSNTGARPASLRFALSLSR